MNVHKSDKYQEGLKVYDSRWDFSDILLSQFWNQFEKKNNSETPHFRKNMQARDLEA